MLANASPHLTCSVNALVKMSAACLSEEQYSRAMSPLEAHLVGPAHVPQRRAVATSQDHYSRLVVLLEGEGDRPSKDSFPDVQSR